MTPTDITDQRESGVLLIQWSDGHESVLSHALLRNRCRCAECQQSSRRGEPVEADEAVRLTAIEPLPGGLNLAFSDGHARGIYPWPYLYQLSDEVTSLLIPNP